MRRGAEVGEERSTNGFGCGKEKKAKGEKCQVFLRV